MDRSGRDYFRDDRLFARRDFRSTNTERDCGDKIVAAGGDHCVCVYCREYHWLAGGGAAGSRSWLDT